MATTAIRFARSRCASRCLMPSSSSLRVTPCAATNGGAARLFSGGEKGELPIGDKLRSSGGGEEGKFSAFSTVRYGIPKAINPPQRAVEGDTQRYNDKLLDLVMKKDREILALMQQHNNFHILLASQKAQYDKKLSDLEKQVFKEIGEIRDKIKDGETATKLLSQKYDFFKEGNDTRIQNIQYGVVKYIFGMVTVVGGAAVTYLNLKDSTTSWRKWFD